MPMRVHQEPQTCGALEAPDRAIRLPEVVKITARSKTRIYDGIRAGSFPAGFLIGARARAWMLSEVMQWLESKRSGGVV